MNPLHKKLLIYGGLVLAAIYGAAFLWLLGFVPPPAPTLDADQVASLYQIHNVRFRIGVVLCLISGAFLLPWSVVIGAEMVRYEKGIPVLATMQILAGVLGCIFFILPPLLWGVAAFSADRDPALTLLVHEMAFLALMTPIAPFPLQVLPIALVCFGRKGGEQGTAFPRWMGYASLWLVFGADTGVLSVIFKSGPLAWNGLISFYMALTMFSLYVGTLLLLILKAKPAHEALALRSA